MNQKVMTIILVVLSVLACLCGTAVLAQSPGAALLLTGAANPDTLNTPQTRILWQTSDFVLVVPGTVPGATPLAEPDAQADLYLSRITDENLLKHFAGIGSVTPVLSDWYLIELPLHVSKETVLPPGSVYLGYPTPYIPITSTATGPVSVTWSSQVQNLVDAISQTQLISDLTALVDFETRYSYAQPCRDAAAWLGSEYEALGYDVTYHEHDRAMAPNVIAEKTGVTAPEEIVIICGHFDSVSLQPMVLAPGADDNGTGTAATLNAARVMAGMHFDRTIRFIAFSGEEQGLRGSQAYAQRAYSQGENIVGVVNLDMVGYVHTAPGDIEVIGNNASVDLVDLFIDCSQTYTALETNRIINGNITASDHAPFWSRGYPAMLGIEDYPVQYPYYHTIQDTVDKITPEFMTETTRAAVATVAHLAEPMMEIVYIYESHLDDSAGDGDGFLDPNETVEIWVEIMNNSGSVSGPITLNWLCLTGSQYIIVLNNTMSIPELQPGESADNRDNPYVILVRPEIPELSTLTCIATLECDAPHSSGFFIRETLTSYDWQDAVILYDMDTDPGWDADSTVWEWGVPTGSGGTEHGHPDPTAGFTGSHVLGTRLDGDYPPNINTTVTSPILDLTDVRLAELRFERWLNVENPQYDKARVWIVNGDGSHLIWENASEITDNHWAAMSLDVSEYADGRNDVQIAFSLETDGGWEYSGWNIDDVRIAGLAPGDPLPTPTPSIPPDTIGVHLDMPDISLESGDDFLLTMMWWNTTPNLYCDMPLFIILDFAGDYWFWPDWSTETDFETRSISPDTVGTPEVILSFVWPDVSGSASGLRFWSAFTDQEITSVIGIYDMIEWGYQ